MLAAQHSPARATDSAPAVGGLNGSVHSLATLALPQTYTDAILTESRCQGYLEHLHKWSLGLSPVVTHASTKVIKCPSGWVVSLVPGHASRSKAWPVTLHTCLMHSVCMLHMYTETDDCMVPALQLPDR